MENCILKQKRESDREKKIEKKSSKGGVVAGGDGNVWHQNLSRMVMVAIGLLGKVR